jgi:hypothetical protein
LTWILQFFGFFSKISHDLGKIRVIPLDFAGLLLRQIHQLRSWNRIILLLSLNKAEMRLAWGSLSKIRSALKAGKGDHEATLGHLRKVAGLAAQLPKKSPRADPTPFSSRSGACAPV